MTIEQLVAKRAAIEAEPKNRNPPGSLWIYTAAAREKLDAIDRDIAHLIREARLARGQTVDDSGYSGRQTNRR